MKIMERKYLSKNGVVERTRYVVGDNTQPRGKRKKGNTSMRKQEANYNTAVRRVARILNCNFDHENGLLVTLDYDAAGLEKLFGKLPEEQKEIVECLQAPIGKVGSWKKRGEIKKQEPKKQQERSCTLDSLGKEAEKEMKKWLRRVKRKAEAVKYLAVTADVDGETGELVRIHHHLVIKGDGLSWDMMRKEWRNGSVDIKQLRSQGDYTPIAVYLMEQVRQKPDAKKYSVSRGMEMPEITEREVLGRAEIRVPAGATVLERMEYSEETVAQYVRYIPKKREYRRKRTAEWKEIENDEI